MFEKLVQPVRKFVRKESNLPMTIEFMGAIVSNGCRLSYGALTLAARELGEDSSGQIPAQRGAALVKSLPGELQPFVCRRDGGYAKGVLGQFSVELPGDLRDRPVLSEEVVSEALCEWRDSR